VKIGGKGGGKSAYACPHHGKKRRNTRGHSTSLFERRYGEEGENPHPRAGGGRGDVFRKNPRKGRTQSQLNSQSVKKKKKHRRSISGREKGEQACSSRSLSSGGGGGGFSRLEGHTAVVPKQLLKIK